MTQKYQISESPLPIGSTRKWSNGNDTLEALMQI